MVKVTFPHAKLQMVYAPAENQTDDQYIDEVADKHGSVVVVLGVRNAESNSRETSIAKHTVDGKILKSHNTNTRAFTLRPY